MQLTAGAPTSTTLRTCACAANDTIIATSTPDSIRNIGCDLRFAVSPTAMPSVRSAILRRKVVICGNSCRLPHHQRNPPDRLAVDQQLHRGGVILQRQTMRDVGTDFTFFSPGQQLL